MTSFVGKIDENDSIKEIENIEKEFLQELYNLKLEELQDLEKIATLKETENIPDDILNLFRETNTSLNDKEPSELTQILGLMNKKDVQRHIEDDNKSTSSEEADDNTTTSSSDEESSSDNDNDNDDNDNDDNDNDNDNDNGNDDNNNDDDDDSIKSDNNTASSSDEEEEENTNDIEDQIKNSALEALRYKIEFEKEKSYVRLYPRKRVGIVNTGASCYLNSAYQMLYSLPFYRKLIMDNTSSLTKVELSIKNNIFDKLHRSNEQSITVNNEEYCPHSKSVNPIQQNEPDVLFEYIFYTSNNQNQNNYSDSVKSMFFINMKNTVTCMNDDELYIITDTDYEYSIYFFLQQYIEYLNSNSQQYNNIQNLINNYADYKGYANKGDNSKDAKCTSHEGAVEKYEYKLEIPDSNRYIFIKLERRGLVDNQLDHTIVIPDKKIKINNIDYTLSGAIVHIGDSGEYGHYIYYQCDENGEYTKKYNDGIVSVFNVDETDSINKNATIFAYTRYPVEENNPVDPLPQNTIKSIAFHPNPPP